MHFEALVEDRSGSIALEIIFEKILGPQNHPHSWKIHYYSGVGHLPENVEKAKKVRTRVLLNNLPRLLAGYGQSLREFESAVIVVVDSDRKNCRQLKNELIAVRRSCNPAPTVLFRIAIEEMEAWLLGDRDAIKTAYPLAKDRVLDRYWQDSICGTWEKLADAIYPGGSASLNKLSYPLVGKVKCEWAENIAPHLDVDRNASKSFQVFRDGVRRLAAG